MMELPEDLIPHILSYLPVVSLLRFKSVCKSWLSLIESPNFYCQQLHHDEDNLIVLTTSPCHKYAALSRYVNDYNLGITLLSGKKFHVSEKFDFPQPFDKDEVAVKLVASCNGILCLGRGSNYNTHYNREFSLFNPTTKQFKLLPISPFPLPKSSDSDEELDVSVHAGFGFDFKTNDYKIVRFSCYCSSNDTNETQVEVYSLNTDSWKAIDVVVPVAIVPDKSDRDGNLKTPFQNRIYCWLGQINDHCLPDKILTFDFSKEVFETMPLPDVSNVIVEIGLRLALLRENIACMGATQGEVYVDWSIWMLNEYGVKDSWTKVYTILWEDFMGYPTVFLKSGEIIGKKLDCVLDEIDLSLLHPATKELEVLPGQTLLREFAVVPYKKTLVSVKSA